MHFSINQVLILSLTLLLSSCGDLFTSNDSERDLQLATGGCDASLDTEAFGKILEANIEPEIFCLQELMEQYMDIVNTGRPGYLSQTDLEAFITRNSQGGNISEEDQDTLNIIDAIFDISFIIFGGENGYIARTNVKRITEFLKFFNRNIIPVYNRFSDERKVAYEVHRTERDAVAFQIDKISTRLKELMVLDREGAIDQIDTKVFLNNFFGDKPDTLNKITSLMFLKRVFLGGGIFRLTHFEFHSALSQVGADRDGGNPNFSKIANLAMAAYDFAKAERFNFKDEQTEMFQLYLDDINIARYNIFTYADGNQKLFDLDNIIEALYALVPEIDEDIFGNEDSNTDFRISDYKNEILALKEPFFGADQGRAEDDPVSKDFSQNQFFLLLERLEFLLSKGQDIYRIYDLYAQDLATEEPLSMDFDFPESPVSAKDFSRMVSDYKFIKGNFKSPTYDYKYNRNADAFFEVTAIEYALKLIMSVYGEARDDARGGYHMTYDKTYDLIKKIRRFLRDLGIINIGRKGGNEIAGTADNLVLMSTLFQFQSDGCDKFNVCMEVPELTEFLLGLITAMSIKDFFISEMENECVKTGQVDEHGRILVNCFRENFINVMDAPNTADGGRSLSDYMPKLSEYIKSLTLSAEDPNDIMTSEAYVKFIAETESFTRPCTHFATKDEPLPMKGTDAFAVFAGLLNLESTFLRLDRDQNGIMDGKNKNNNEVMWAYNNVYKLAIERLVAPKGGFMKKLAKPIFKYLIKYGRVPDTKKFSSIWKFIKFLVKFNKRADASRMTIATILKTLGEQSETSKEFPFKCECLEGPVNTCEPEDGAWE